MDNRPLLAVLALAAVILVVAESHSAGTRAQSSPLIRLQASTPGVAQTGHLNVTGNGIFGGRIGVNSSNPAASLAIVSPSGTVGLSSQSPGADAIRGNSTTGIGVAGTSDSFFGLYGSSNSSYAVYGVSSSNYAIRGWYGSTSTINLNGWARSGVWGDSGTGNGVIGTSSYSNGIGVLGWATGFNSYGIYGNNDSGIGVRGVSNSGWAIRGDSATNDAIHGIANNGVGVFGNSNSNNGVQGVSNSGTGVRGDSTGAQGVLGVATGPGYGVLGINVGSTCGMVGTFGASWSLGLQTGVSGSTTGNGFGVFGWAPNGTGVFGHSDTGWAGQMNGNFSVSTPNGNRRLVAIGDTRIPGTLYNVDGPGLMFCYGTDGSDISGTTYVIQGGQATNQGGVFVGHNGNLGALMYMNPDLTTGTITASLKNFREQNPKDPETDIVYCCVEGPEAAAYIRGTAHLTNGRATILLPEHFTYVSSLDGMTVQLTPLSAVSKGLAVTRKGLESGIDVQEIAGGNGSYDFDYLVTCVRKKYEKYQPIQPKLEVMQSGDTEDRLTRVGNWASSSLKQKSGKSK